MTEFTTEKDIDIGLLEKTVRRVVLQNPNLRYKNVNCPEIAGLVSKNDLWVGGLNKFLVTIF